MKTFLLTCAISITATALLAADESPKDQVVAAAKRLGDQTNYTWTTTIVVPEDAQFHPAPIQGKTEKDGFTHVSTSFMDNTVELALKGGNSAFTDRDGAWQSAKDAEGEEGPGRFMAMWARNLQTPAQEAAELAGLVKEFKKDGDVYSGDLTDEGAKTKLTFRGGNASVSGEKGSAKFWIKDGVLTKYEYKVKGTVNWNGNDFENDRDTTVEIKDVGATKVEVPEAAKKKLS